MMYVNAPLLEAIAAASRARSDLNAQNITTTVWSWWKMSYSDKVRPELDRCSALGIELDIMGFAFNVMFAEWSKDDSWEHGLYGKMEANEHLKLPVQLFEMVSRWRGGSCGGPPMMMQPSFAYSKIATLLDFTEVTARAGDPASFLSAIESFGAGIGQWLKVAADCKAQLVQSSMHRREARRWETCVELGTFVGYTAIRLARWAGDVERGPGRTVSVEVDPIHALLTRHHLSLAWLAPLADVWVGQALDVLPRLPEELGAKSLALAFMDHRGTKFHSDLFRLQRHGSVPGGALHVCDNVLKPGAPVCLWLVSRRPGGVLAGNWSMNEFAHWNSEDWMLVSTVEDDRVWGRRFRDPS